MRNYKNDIIDYNMSSIVFNLILITYLYFFDLYIQNSTSI